MRLGRHRKMKRSRSVRAYVVRLVVAVAVPLLVFGAFLLIRSADNEQRAIATIVQERAQGAAADLDRPPYYGQGPCSLIVSLKSSPSERKGRVVPSIAFRNTSRSDCCAPLRVVPIVVKGGNSVP
jgi:hypothetical protein